MYFIELFNFLKFKFDNEILKKKKKKKQHCIQFCYICLIISLYQFRIEVKLVWLLDNYNNIMLICYS